MEDSSTYQATLAKGRTEGRVEGREEGRAEEARNLLMRIARKRLGSPTAHAETTIQSMPMTTLEGLVERVLEVESWDELLP